MTLTPTPKPKETEIPVIQKICGGLYAGIWYISILIGFFYLHAPLLPLLFVRRSLYRRLTDILFSAWESFNVSLLEICFGYSTFLSGDHIRPEENSLILLNHRTRVDWNFFWAALLHGTSPPAHNAKLVLKDEVKEIPGVGWAMQMSRFLYISRKWEKDEGRLGKLVEYLGRHCKGYQIVLFPEGTNWTPETVKKSRAFEEANNLKSLNWVLQPRTTGFTSLVQQMREHGGLHSVYDVTIAYPDQVPEKEKDLVEGKLPKQVHFHIKRHSAQSLPTTFIGLEKWLQELWREKDVFLQNFYKEGVRTSSRPQLVFPLQYLSLVAWLAFTLKMLQMLLTSWCPCHWLWITSVSVFMALISKYTNGLQEIEADLENGLLGPRTILNVFVNLFKRNADPKRD